MFFASHLHGFNARAVGAITKTYVGTTANTSDLTVYTFSGHSIGTAATDRIVVVGVSALGGSAPSISSVTIAGVAASAIVSVVGNSALLSAIYTLLVPTGTTADIEVTFSAGQNRCAISVWTLTGTGGSGAAYSTATDGTPSTTGDVAVPAGGAVIALVYGNVASVGAVSWSGVTEDNDQTMENTSNRYSAASAQITAGQTLTVTPTFAATTPTSEALVVAAFSPG